MTCPLLNALPPDAHTSSLWRRFLQVVHQRSGFPPAVLREAVLEVLLVRADASGGQNPIRNIANYFLAVSGSDGFMDVAGGFTCVVECGEKHVVVPKQVVRQKEVPVVELTKDEATDFCARTSLSRLPSAA